MRTTLAVASVLLDFWIKHTASVALGTQEVVIASLGRGTKMVRRPRVEMEGRVFRVSNRFASGEVVFSGPHQAAGFIETIREAK